MLMVGFFENLRSEREIAARCGDSLMIRRFLGYDLTEDTPHHSSLSVIRSRLSSEVFQSIFDLILEGLTRHGLLRGKNLGLDSTFLEANASLRALENRNTGEAYWDYVKRLAIDAGVDGKDMGAVRRFDRDRPGRKTSNEEWVNPNDPDAKVARAKDGATDMLYKPENIVDLDNGTIVRASVRLAHEGDTQGLGERVIETAAFVSAIAASEKELGISKPATLTADKGYYCVEEVQTLREAGLKAVISDPLRNRRMDRLGKEEAAAVRETARRTRSIAGKKLLRKRGMYIERSFAHLLNAGGTRRTTLRGKVNLNKRYQISAATYNLSQMMRALFGVGTPKQAASGVRFVIVGLTIINESVQCGILIASNVCEPTFFMGLVFCHRRP
jgi:transposase